MLTLDYIAQKTAPVLAKAPVVRAFVFGAYARGQATASSDVDSLVELDERPLIGLIEYIQLRDALEQALRQKVDLVATDGVSPYLKPAIDREKRLIYDA